MEQSMRESLRFAVVHKMSISALSASSARDVFEFARSRNLPGRAYSRTTQTASCNGLLAGSRERTPASRVASRPPLRRARPRR